MQDSGAITVLAQQIFFYCNEPHTYTCKSVFITELNTVGLLIFDQHKLKCQLIN